MLAAKLVVIYPVPTDLEKFERLYLEQRVPMAVDRLAGKTKIVATKGHPLHLNLLALRCSDVGTIAHASSGAQGFLIGRVRLLEFFRGCGTTNRR